MMTEEERIRQDELQKEEERRKREERLRLQQMQAQQMRQSPQVDPSMAMNFIPSGGEGAAGGEAGFMETAGEYIAPVLAMYGLVKGGNELGIGARDQAREYRRFGRKLDDELFEKMKFWEWF